MAVPRLIFKYIIPGHAKSRSGSGKSSGGKSPRNSIPKSPSTSSLLSKSPKSPKSPTILAGLTDNELQKLKESIITPLEDSVEEQNDTTKKSSVVTFEEDL